jgi:predicted AlkP superfamily pyrophosphatase or phosphodiesterase
MRSMKWLVVLLMPVSLIAGTVMVRATAAPTSPGTYLVLIVLDGAQPSDLSVPNTPHVQALIKNGTQYTNAFAGILESETPSGHVAISTGSEPRKDGIPSFWWATSENTQVNLFSPIKIRAGDMEKIVQGSHVPTIAGLIHAKNPKAQVVALSGNKYYAADAIGGPNANAIMYYSSTANGQWAPTYIPGHAPAAGVLTAPGLTTKASGMPLGTIDHLAMKLAVASFQRTRQQVTLINVPEFDWPLGHVYGGTRDPKDVRTLMQGFDRDLGMLEDAYRNAGVLDHTVFVLTADHGMMPLTHTVAQSDLTGAVTRAGAKIISQAYTSGTYLWLSNEKVATAAGQNIAKLHNPHIQSVYVRIHTSKGFAYTRVTSSKVLRTPAVDVANQYLVQSFNGSNAPDVVVLFAEGTGCEPGGQAKWKADHGGASWEAQHIPLVISGPGVRSGFTSSSPARLIDLAPTALQLLAVPHTGMQGIVLADSMKTPPGWATKTQATLNKQLSPVVSALQRESSLEVSAKP